MRKDELMYLHQLLATVKRDLDERGVTSSTAADAYADVSVSPVAAYAQKGDHEAAVMALASDLSAAVSDESADRDADERPQPVSP
jgi:hypothetical protein